MPKPYSQELEIAYKNFLNVQKQFQKKKIERESYMNARDRFCKLHSAEKDIIPLGKEKGYRTDIDFTKVEQRILRIQNQIAKFLNPDTPSHFRSQVNKIWTKKVFKKYIMIVTWRSLSNHR